jgi:hypothetical protein
MLRPGKGSRPLSLATAGDDNSSAETLFVIRAGTPIVHAWMICFDLWRKPHHAARPDFLDGSALALDPADAESDDERLAERMGAPGCARACLKSNGGALSTRGLNGLELKGRYGPFR